MANLIQFMLKKIEIFQWKNVFLIISFIFLIVFTCPCAKASVILNEVLANEPGSKTSLEWIELFNSDSLQVDLRGWSFVEGSTATGLRGVLNPQAFCVIARDTSAFESYWGNASGIWGDVASECFMLLHAKMSLSNGSDSVSIIDPMGAVSGYGWHKDTGDGISMEKRSPFSGNGEENWGVCMDSLKSTPGKRNSISPYYLDAGITPGDVRFIPSKPDIGDNITVYLTIRNYGCLHLKDSIEIMVSMDGEKIKEENMSVSLNPGASSQCDFTVLNIQKGRHLFSVDLVYDKDQNPVNNHTEIWLNVGADGRTRVVLNEVLANEPGADNELEWIELYNADSVAVNLKGWILEEGGASRTIDQDVFLEPFSFLILSPCPDSAYANNGNVPTFEAKWGDGSGVWGDSFIENFKVIPLYMQLTNSGESITLCDGAGYKASFTWSYDPGDGISWEKLDPFGDDSDANWLPAPPSIGSTPGSTNSATSADNDLSIDRESVDISPRNPAASCSAIITIKAVNAGTASSKENTIYLIQDVNFNSRTDRQDVILDSLLIPILSSGGTWSGSFEVSKDAGKYRFIALIKEDQKTFNNNYSFDIIFGNSSKPVIINEFMNKPDTQKHHPEWVEIFNPGSEEANLNGWTLGDGVEDVKITSRDMILKPGDYAVIVQDLSEFYTQYLSNTNFNFEIIELDTWNELLNSEDIIVLKDSKGFELDRVSYGDSWKDMMKSDNDVSLERIDPDGLSNDSKNWWFSLDPRGSTPGSINSVSKSILKNINVKVFPDPFSPDGDGFEDNTSISLELPPQTYLTMNIYNLAGEVVKTFFNQAPYSGGIVVWDGRDKRGRKLPLGIYILYIETNGQISEKIKRTIVIAAPLN